MVLHSFSVCSTRRDGNWESKSGCLKGEMQSPNYFIWLIWIKVLPFNCPLPKIHWEIRSSSWDIVQHVSHNSPSDSFSTVVPRYFLFGRERMWQDFVAAFPFLKMSFSAKHNLDSDSGIVMNIQPCQFEPRRGKCDVTPNTIRTFAPTRIESLPCCFPVNTKALYLGN